jgi:hypothetical protein
MKRGTAIALTVGSAAAAGAAIYLVTRQRTQPAPAGTSQLAIASTTLSVIGTSIVGPAVHAVTGHDVGLAVSVANSGTASATASVSAEIRLPSGTVEGHFYAAQGVTAATAAGASRIATVTVPPGAATTADLYSGPMADSGEIAGYSAASGLTVVISVLDTDTGQVTTAAIPGAIFLAPPSSSEFAIVSAQAVAS